MEATSFEAAGRQIAISSIDAYKTYISPRKGFSCAHRMLHQGDSCSDYVKRMFSTENFMPALQMSRQRFRDCAGAAQILKASKATGGCIIIPCCLPI